MAVGPLYYSLYDAVCVRMASEFPDGGTSLNQTNRTLLTPAEVEDMVRQLMTADADTVWDLLTAHLKNGKSIRSLGDTIQLGAAELILRTTVPRQFTNGQHPFDYCNVANNWFRRSDNPYQPRVLYLMTHFINDVAHENKLQNLVIEQEAAGIVTGGRSPDTLLRDLDEAIMALDFPRATAFANAYLQSGADRNAYQSAVALAACPLGAALVPRECEVDQTVEQLRVADARLVPQAGIHGDRGEAGDRVHLIGEKAPTGRPVGALLLEEEVDTRHRLAPARLERPDREGPHLVAARRRERGRDQEPGVVALVLVGVRVEVVAGDDLTGRRRTEAE